MCVHHTRLSVTGAGNSVDTNGLFTAGATPGVYTISATAESVTGTAIANVTPVPVLTRLKIIPDTVTVPLNASQQFTVRAYDQFDSLMTTPAITWSTTGTGNTISSTGIFTAGTNVGTHTVTAIADTVSGTAVVTTGYGCTVNNKHEAESSSNYASGPYLETCTDVGGGQNFAGLNTGKWFAYNTLNVPVSGLYNISFRVSTTAPAQISVGHSGMRFGIIDIPNTGGAWQTITDTITLPALSYTGIHVYSGTFKFNWFSIDNCAPDSLNASGLAYAKQPVENKNAPSRTVLFPNPTYGPVNVDIRPDAYKTAMLLDMQGRVISRWSIQQGQTRLNIDLGSLQNGVYILKLEGEKGTENLRVVKL